MSEEKFPMFPIFKHLGLFLKSDLFLPLILIVIYICFIIFIRGVIPTSQELIDTFSSLYAKYGYEIILTAAFLEALIVVNFFVPGVIAMAMGAIFASTGQIELSLVILTASIGAIAGYTLDFVLGYFGIAEFLNKYGYKDFISIAKQQILKLGNKGLIIGFIYPATGCIVAVASGAVKISFLKYISVMIPAVLFWMSIWGILFYIIGETLLNIITKYSFVVVLFIIASIFITRLWKKDSKKARE